MKLPEIMEEIVNCIKIQCDNELEVYPIYNMFLARFSSAIASKNILTDSSRHSEEKPLAYYSLNFLPSGGNKDKPFTIIKNLFRWLDIEYDNKNDELKERFINGCIKKLPDSKKEDVAALNKIKENAENLSKLKTRINGATSQKIYQICDLIRRSEFGSLFFFDTEFVNKFEKTNKNGNYDDTLASIYNLYEGVPDFTDTALTDRSAVEKISCSVCFASDFGKMLRTKKLRESFNEYLAGGFARRTFIYTSKETNGLRVEVDYPELEEKMVEKNKMPALSERLHQLYDMVQPNRIYKFSFEADKLINEYHQETKKYVREHFSYADVLPIEDEIIKVDLEGSAWKIIKTAFLFHFMIEPSKLEVSANTVQIAIDYYKTFQKFLPILLNKQTLGETQKFKIFVYKHLDEKLKLNSDEIKRLFSADPAKWKAFKRDLLPDILEELENEGIYNVITKDGRLEYIKFYRKEK